MDEFEIIRRFWKPLSLPAARGTVRGIGDDCAELAIPDGQHLIQSVDTLVSGVHFLPDIDPEDLGWRALAVSASDLAAAGATPWNALLAITLPTTESAWLEGFARGLGAACRAFELPLVGGDSTRGPLTITLQVQGLCPPGQSLGRAGARAGDRICVSGSLGDAGEALRWLGVADENLVGKLVGKQDEKQDVIAVKNRYLRPVPRLSLGMLLRQQASACIDISDGLLADLGHILAASGVGASIDLAAIPLSAPLQALAKSGALELALTAGDDYELCFTWPRSAGDPAQLNNAGVAVTVIGEIEDAPGMRFCNGPPGWERPRISGYRHFSGEPGKSD